MATGDRHGPTARACWLGTHAVRCRRAAPARRGGSTVKVVKRNVPIDELRVGHVVDLSNAWLDHPFLRSRFRVSSQEQIAKMRRHGMRQVLVDFDKSDVRQPGSIAELAYVSHNDATPDPKDQSPPPAWNPDNLVPQELGAVLGDRRISGEGKARAVYRHSVKMMERLLEAPTAENIKAGKSAIFSVTDMILTDDQTASALLRITQHDFYTYTHSVNVGVSSLMLAKALFGQSDAHNLHELGAGFFLHDLGKVKVDPEIINKPAKLTEEEMRRMRIHPYQGCKLLQGADALSEECRVVVMEHHELMDGNGYPRRLAGEEIHIYSRICCIADVFDALTAERSYKKAMAPFDALTLMRDRMGAHFDRRLFGAFVRLYA